MRLQDHKAEDAQVLQVPKLGDDFELCEHLTLGEFKSRDGYGLCLVHPALVVGFILLRREIGIPMRVQSGFRSELHNARIGGSPRSFHMSGMAMDLCPAVPEEEILEVLIRMRDLAAGIGMGGIKLYRDKRFLHVDVGPGRIW